MLAKCTGVKSQGKRIGINYMFTEDICLLKVAMDSAAKFIPSLRGSPFLKVLERDLMPL